MHSKAKVSVSQQSQPKVTRFFFKKMDHQVNQTRRINLRDVPNRNSLWFTQPWRGRVRWPQNPPPSLRKTPRQMAPPLPAVRAERLRPGIRAGNTNQPKNTMVCQDPKTKPASHDHIVDAFKLGLNHFRVVFEPHCGWATKNNDLEYSDVFMPSVVLRAFR